MEGLSEVATTLFVFFGGLDTPSPAFNLVPVWHSTVSTGSTSSADSTSGLFRFLVVFCSGAGGAGAGKDVVVGVGKDGASTSGTMADTGTLAFGGDLNKQFPSAFGLPLFLF